MFKTILGMVGMSRFAIGIVTLLCFSAFSMGAVAGSNSVSNESISASEIHHDLTTEEQELHSSFNENFTSYEKIIVYGAVGPSISGGFGMAHEGVDFGVAHPTKARWLGASVGPLSVLYLAWLILPVFKNIHRRVN